MVENSSNTHKKNYHKAAVNRNKSNNRFECNAELCTRLVLLLPAKSQSPWRPCSPNHSFLSYQETSPKCLTELETCLAWGLQHARGSLNMDLMTNLGPCVWHGCINDSSHQECMQRLPVGIYIVTTRLHLQSSCLLILDGLQSEIFTHNLLEAQRKSIQNKK